jgi:nitrile hydratase subunit beta
MTASTQASTEFSHIPQATGQAVLYPPGSTVRVLTRSPFGHYRVPIYLRGHKGTVQKVLEPMQLDNERESYGQNGGDKQHYYRVAFALKELWPDYAGPAHDILNIEVFETWLERI